MSRIRSLRAIAWTTVTALLFAQGVVAFADCKMSAPSPALAIAAENPPCHESSGETNMCVAHCLAGDQSLDKPQASVLEPAIAPVLVIRLASDDRNARGPALWRFVPPPAAPPPRILFRTLRI